MEPLVFEFLVDCSPDHAFKTWTTEVSRWWPSDHSVSGRSDLDVIFEPHVGGRIFERLPDGTEHDWGEVLESRPPHKLIYLWHIAADRSDATEVEVNFEQRSDQTSVRIEHRGWERLGSSAEAGRTANRAGWGALLPMYTEACWSDGAASLADRPCP